MTNWLEKWQRSPRQDRRVIVDGKFVELTEPIQPLDYPEPIEEETNDFDEGGSTRGDVQADRTVPTAGQENTTNQIVHDGYMRQQTGIDETMPDSEILQTGVSDVIENTIQPVENTTISPSVVEKPISPDVLAGPVRRTGFNSPRNVEGGITEGTTEDDVDKAFTFLNADKASKSEDEKPANLSLDYGIPKDK